MDNPFTPPTRRKSQSPVPRNSFQMELDAKMQERRRKGLSVEISDNEDEILSDNEFIEDSMSSKPRTSFSRPDDRKSSFSRQSPFEGSGSRSPFESSERRSPYDGLDRKSPYGSDSRKSPYDSDLRKSPHSSESRRSPYGDRSSPAADSIFGKKSSVLDEDDDDGLGMMKTMRKPWQPTATRKSPNPMLKRSPIMDDLDEADEPLSARGDRKPWDRGLGVKGKENERPGEANSRHRKTPTLYDSIEDDEKPKPSPRARSRFGELDDADEDFPKPKPRQRGQPTKSTDKPKSRGSSPSVDIFGRSKDEDKTDGRKTTTGRKTPTEGRKTPTDGRKTPGSGRNSILDFLANASDSDTHEHKAAPRRKGLLDSDSDEEVKKASYGSSNKKPSLFGSDRKSPSRDDSRKSPYGHRRKSTLDDDDDTERPRSAFRPTPNRRSQAREEEAEPEGRGRSRKANRDEGEREERESSICRDVDKDPTMKQRPTTEEGEVITRKQPKHQRKDKKRAEEAIDSVEAAQVENKMRFIDPDKEKEAKEEGEKKRNTEKPPPSPRIKSKSFKNESTSRKKPVPAPRKTLSFSSTLPSSLGTVYFISNEEEETSPRTTVPIPHSAPVSPRSQPVSPVHRPLCSCQKAKSSYALLESLSKTTRTQKYKPSPRYAKPQVDELTTSVSSLKDFNSTSDLRQAVYADWYKERMVKAKEVEREKRRVKKEEEEKEKKAKADKYTEAKQSYDAWVESKKDDLNHQRKEKTKEEKKKMAEVEEKQKKREEADLSYRSWKETKDEIIKEKQRKAQKETKTKIKGSQEEREAKRVDSAKAFRGWKEKKDESLVDKKKEQQKALKEKQEKEREEQREREKEALKQYHAWIDKKETQQYNQTKFKSTMEPRKPWSPANRTIPMGS